MSNQLGQIYGTVKNAETYIVLNSENVELSGNVYINGGLAIDNSFGISGEVLISQGSTSSPKWASMGGITDVSNLDASSVSLIELSNNTLFYTPIDISGYQLQLDVLQNAPSGSGSLTLINNPTGGTLNRLSYTPPVVISSSSPTFTGTVTAGSLCTTGAYKINNNRFTVNTAGYLNINRANGAGAGEWDSGNGNIVVATLYYTGQVFYSDDRIKSNTRDISNATTTLMKLKPVQYEKHPDLIVPEGVENTDLTGVEHYTETGFVAQEVEKIPELAYTVEAIKYNKDKLKGIKISDFIPFLVKALQEQETRIQALENK